MKINKNKIEKIKFCTPKKNDIKYKNKVISRYKNSKRQFNTEKQPPHQNTLSKIQDQKLKLLLEDIYYKFVI